MYMYIYIYIYMFVKQTTIMIIMVKGGPAGGPRRAPRGELLKRVAVREAYRYNNSSNNVHDNHSLSLLLV